VNGFEKASGIGLAAKGKKQKASKAVLVPKMLLNGHVWMNASKKEGTRF
jgi:hypothetical protein